MKPKKATEAPRNSGIDPSTLKMKQWYNGHDRVSDKEAPTGTDRASYQAREPIEDDDERLAMRQGDMPPPVPQEHGLIIVEASSHSPWGRQAQRWPFHNVSTHCTFGQLLKESEASQHFHQWRLDAFSIENYVIKKVRPRGARHGKTEAQKEHFVAHNARKRCIKKKKMMEFTIVSNEIQKIVIRNSKIGWTEETCIAMDKLAQEDHSYCPVSEEFERYRKWFFTLNKSVRNAPTKLRSDFQETLTNMHRLHRESGEERPEPPARNEVCSSRFKSRTTIVLLAKRSELFKVIQDAILLILHYRTMWLFRAASSSTFLCRMCNQFTFQHQFRIDTGRSKFEQKTDSILSVCGFYGQRR